MSLNTVTLTSAIRTSLFNLQQTSQVLDTTQKRLATGKRVNSALDDPTVFFTALNHQHRAGDLMVRKDQMSEAIQTIKAANSGIETITTLIASARSLAQSALSAESDGEKASYSAQFNKILAQIDAIADDSGYKGINLLGGSSEQLEVEFDESGDSNITVTGFDATTSGLDINESGMQEYSDSATTTVAGQSFSFPVSSVPASSSPATLTIHADGDYTIGQHSGASPEVVTWNIDGLASGTGAPGLGTVIVQNSADDVEWEQSFSIDATTMSQITSDGSFTVQLTNSPEVNYDIDPSDFVSWTLTMGSSSPTANNWSTTAGIQNSLDELESGLSDLRTQFKTLSSGLNIITTRQDFTMNMVNTLSDGAANLTLADMNEEGANMLMLKTRQKLEISSLNFASKSSQSVLRLF